MSGGNENLFVFRDGWNNASRQHPAMKFMEEYTVNFLDSRKFDEAKDWHTDDYSYVKSDGTKYDGFEKAWPGILETYGPLVAHTHLPTYGTVSETSEGWSMFGAADCFFNLPGAPSAGESKVKDPNGKEWDVYIPGAFGFDYVKDGSAKYGVKLKESRIYSDSAPVIMLLARRGVIQLG